MPTAAAGALSAPGVAVPLPFPPDVEPEELFSPVAWGMLAFLLSEVAFFSTLIVTYVSFLGQDGASPTPAAALSLPLTIGTTLCLLASSVTIHLATHALRSRGAHGVFRLWWSATILLGVAFLLGTAYEWRELIEVHHLTISRNLFGSSFYTLVGFHGAHVTVGIVVMSIVLLLAWRKQLDAEHHLAAEMTAWYWHFVDVVWLEVFTVVYVVGR